MKSHWSAPDAFGRQRCIPCRGRGHWYGRLRPAVTCGNCGGKGCRVAKGAGDVMRVSDEDIDRLRSSALGSPPTVAAWRMMKTELLALRKVAQAAADLCMIDSRAGAVTGLADALKAAGRGNGGAR